MWLHKPNVDAMLLFGLFDKYKSNVPIDVKVYRGMSLSEEDFNRFGFNDIAKGDLHTPDEAAIVSFSMDKRIAYGFAESEGKTHNIGYIMDGNNGNLFDIRDISAKAYEKETILIWYKVDFVKEFKAKDSLWKIIKISPAE
ncbi:MAG: hypothetical protein WCW84_02265 [Sulfurimonas sp.]